MKISDDPRVGGWYVCDEHGCVYSGDTYCPKCHPVMNRWVAGAALLVLMAYVGLIWNLITSMFP